MTADTLKVIFFILLIIGLFFLAGAEIGSEKDTVTKWAADHNLQVQSVEGPNCWDIGPYWYQKHLRVYKLSTSTGMVYWFRTPQIWSDWNIYIETSAGQYEKVQ